VVYELVELPAEAERSTYGAAGPDSEVVGRGVVGPRSGGGRTAKNGAKPHAETVLARDGSEWAEARRRSASEPAPTVVIA